MAHGPAGSVLHGIRKMVAAQAGLTFFGGRRRASSLTLRAFRPFVFSWLDWSAAFRFCNVGL